MSVFLVPLICLLLTAVLGWACKGILQTPGTDRAIVALVILIVLTVIAAMGTIVSAYEARTWISAGIRANTYNQINETKYTQEQFYYAADVIDPSLNQEK